MANSPYRYLNKVLLKGRLGKDPELRFMPSGDPVCNFSIATRSGKHVEWHKIVAYEKLAEYVNAAFATGDFVYVEAEIRTREFQTAEDKANNRKPRKVLELIAGEAHLLAKRGESNEAADDDLPAAGDGEGSAPAAAAPDTQGGDDASGLPKYI
jgi:single-strand DNA-binding protein